MNKFTVLLFALLIGIFGALFFVLQGKSFKDSLSASPAYLIPTLPDDAVKLQQITPAPQQGQETANSQQQTQPNAVAPTFGVEEGMKASYSAVIKTSKGDISLTLNAKAAPNTVKNFITKAQSGFYTGLLFHRVEDWVIQGGDPKGTGTGGGLMRTELNDIPFTAGSLGVARGGDINVSNDSQFFITKTDAGWLNQQYTNFGQVTGGMDVVGKIVIGDKILAITVE